MTDSRRKAAFVKTDADASSFSSLHRAKIGYLEKKCAAIFKCCLWNAHFVCSSAAATALHSLEIKWRGAQVNRNSNTMTSHNESGLDSTSPPPFGGEGGRNWFVEVKHRASVLRYSLFYDDLSSTFWGGRKTAANIDTSLYWVYLWTNLSALVRYYSYSVHCWVPYHSASPLPSPSPASTSVALPMPTSMLVNMGGNNADITLIMHDISGCIFLTTTQQEPIIKACTSGQKQCERVSV